MSCGEPSIARMEDEFIVVNSVERGSRGAGLVEVVGRDKVELG